MGSGAPTAFVTWAHRARDWTSTQAQEWEHTVLRFTDALRRGGVDADVDLYHYSDKEVDWTRYGTQAIDEVDTTIIAISKAWADRWSGTNPPTEGAGAAREADALHGKFDKNQQQFQSSVKIVVLPGATKADIPADLRRVTCYEITDFSPESMEALLRTLHGKPQYTRPALGPVPHFASADPAVKRATSTSSDHGWRALESPVQPVSTLLDDGKLGSLNGVLEFQLVRESGAPPVRAADLRGLAADMTSRVEATRPPADVGGANRTLWEVRSAANAERATATVHSRFPHDQVVPEFLSYLWVFRDGSIVVAMQLRRDALSAKVNEESLVATARRLLSVGQSVLPGSADAVPILRLGPMSDISPGDPSTLRSGGSATATFPWMSRRPAATKGDEAISKHYLHVAIDSVAAELVAQLVTELDDKPYTAIDAFGSGGH